jgi:hypothetical protein
MHERLILRIVIMVQSNINLDVITIDKIKECYRLNLDNFFDGEKWRKGIEF